jgi:hypothetical protein
MLPMWVCIHSHFVQNHLIRILKDGPLISEVVLSHPQAKSSLASETFANNIFSCYTKARSRSGSIFSKALGELGSEAPFFGSRPPTPAFHRKASQGVQNGGRTPAGRVPPCTPTTRPHARSHSGALNSMYFLFF